VTTIPKPGIRPANPRFSSGPCTKRPGWSPKALEAALVGRSHRHKSGQARIREVLDRSRAILGIPADYRIAVVPASDTGAMEMALWSLLGPKGVDVLNWENFGATWAADVGKQLKLTDLRVLQAPFGELPDLGAVDFGRDVVFVWNGTSSGVRVPDGKWIPADREGLTICDATSAAFAQDMAWDKLDVVTWSWQKVLGGEAGHGMLALSPRAVERLESHAPAWPMPKIFRLTKDGKFFDEPFEALTINTPSLLCVEDAIDGLKWAERVGGLKALIARADGNFGVLRAWVENTPWIDFLARDPKTRSNTSVCLKVVDPWLNTRPEDFQKTVGKKIAGLLEKEGAAFDIASHRAAPPGLRIWAGATVEKADLAALIPWLDWAWASIKEEQGAPVHA
jgi:phosphoserine aminotransferase